MATESMMTASTSTNAAAANSPRPIPPAVKLTLSSDFASSISLLISVRRSRWASVTSRPMVGSSAGAGGVAMRLLLLVLACPSDQTLQIAGGVLVQVLLEDIGYAVPVLVELLGLADPPVHPVAQAQHHRGEAGGGERADEDSDLGELVA